MEQASIKIFIAYSRVDSEMLGELRKQFSPLEKAGKIVVWSDGEIRPGDEWDEKIQSELNMAELILLLVSPDSIFSKYFYESEVNKAILRHNNGETRVIPIILRPCLWQETPIGALQSLPHEGKAVINWSPIDSGYFNVVENIQKTVEDLLWLKSKETSNPNALITRGIIAFHDLENNRVEYDGEIINGRAHGQGVARSFGNNCYRYTGLYQNNKRHDKNARIEWSNGSRYEGSFVEDKRTGKGKFYFNNDWEYEGDFSNNIMTGIGTLKTDKYNYEGELMGQRPHRLGKMIHLKEEYIYEGEFWEGIKSGKGKIEYKNGWYYEGDFLEDQPYGKGKRLDQNGIIYEGWFKNGKAHGLGKIYKPDCFEYAGFFENDWLATDKFIVDPEGSKIELLDGARIRIEDLKLNEPDPPIMQVRVTLFSGEIIEGGYSIGERWVSNRSPHDGEYKENYVFFSGDYTIKKGIKILIRGERNFEIAGIEYDSGVFIDKVDGVYFLIKRVFSFFPVMGAKDVTLKKINNYYDYSIYRWKNGKEIMIKNDRDYGFNFETGELIDGNGNGIKNEMIDIENASTFKPWWKKFRV